MKTTITRPSTQEEIKVVKVTHYFDGDPLKPVVTVMEGGVPHTHEVDMHSLWQNATQEQRDTLRLFFTRINRHAMNAQLDQYGVTLTDGDIEQDTLVDPVEEDPIP